MLKEDTGKPSAVRATGEPHGSWTLAAWWMICRPAKGGVEVKTVTCQGGRALALFGHEEEAGLFLWSLGDEGYDAGWRIRKSRCGEVASVLCGPCANVERVVLDPLPAMVADGTAALVSVDRGGFLASLLAIDGTVGGPGAGRGLRSRPSVGECAAFREEREEGVNRIPRNIGDSVVVVTGASSSIGRATARLFAENGARVVLAARSEGSLREAADECEAAHVLLSWPQTSSPRAPTQFGPFSPRQGPLCAR